MSNKLTIVITTYNLEKYIAQALESILMQKVDFAYKILIADDCSADGTLGILKNYQNKYPDKIDIITSERNLGSLANSTRALDKVQGEYISFLDGDDYWLEDIKLQKQIDFLDNNPDFSMCGANTKVFNEDSNTFSPLHKFDNADQEFSFDDYINERGFFIHTSSIILRNTIYVNGMDNKFKEAVGQFYECAYRGEDVRFVEHLQKGKVKFFNQFFSVYRVHKNGVWQGSSQFKRDLEGSIGLWEFAKFFGKESSHYFLGKFASQYKQVVRTLAQALLLENQTNISPKEMTLLEGLFKDLKSNNFVFKNNQSLSKKWKYKVFMGIYKILKKKLEKKGLI